MSFLSDVPGERATSTALSVPVKQALESTTDDTISAKKARVEVESAETLGLDLFQITSYSEKETGGKIVEQNLRVQNKQLRKWQAYPTLFLASKGVPATMEGFLSIYDEVNDIHPWCDARCDDEGVYIKFDHEEGLNYSEYLAHMFIDEWEGKEIEGFEYELRFEYFPPGLSSNSESKSDTTLTVPSGQLGEPTIAKLASLAIFRANNTILKREKKKHVLFVSYQVLPGNYGHKNVLQREVQLVNAKTSVQLDDHGFFIIFPNDCQAEREVIGFMEAWNGKMLKDAEGWPLAFDHFAPLEEIKKKAVKRTVGGKRGGKR